MGIPEPVCMTPREAMADLVRERLQREPYLTAVDIAELEYIDLQTANEAVRRAQEMISA